FRTAEFDIMYNEGISLAGDVLDSGVRFSVLKKSGNSFLYGETKLGAGRESAKAFLKENPKIQNELEAAILKKSKEVGVAPAGDDEAEAK
ncbi:MAG: recombinase RecA, partial [Candidatus Moraniibacteriota bacterium]